MFSTPDVWMVFKAGKLAVVEVDGVEHRMAECALVVEPFRLELAEQLGESVRVHLYDDDGALRSDLATITLNPRIPKQVMRARGAEGVPATEMRLVETLSLTCARQQDDKTGEEWIKATFRVRFDFAPKVHREWIAMYFGHGFYANFEIEQGDLLAEVSALDPVQALKDMTADGETIMTFTTQVEGWRRRRGVRIEKGVATPIDQEGPSV